jgi:hypothetical protein
MIKRAVRFRSSGKGTGPASIEIVSTDFTVSSIAASFDLTATSESSSDRFLHLIPFGFGSQRGRPRKSHFGDPAGPAFDCERLEWRVSDDPIRFRQRGIVQEIMRGFFEAVVEDVRGSDMIGKLADHCGHVALATRQLPCRADGIDSYERQNMPK